MGNIKDGVIRWGILGLGRIARDFARSLRELPDAALAAAGSRDAERARAFCAEHGGRPHGSYAELVNDPEVDIVYVATLHHLHEEHTLLALRAGKHVLCEKPISINEASAARMYAEAEKRGLFLMDGLWSRFFPAWEFAKRLADSGDMGAVVAIDSAISWGVAQINPANRLFDLASSGGALLDGGIYNLAAASVILGPDEYPVSIKALTDIGPTGVDYHDGAVMKYRSGVIATMMCGLRAPLMRADILCEYGLITVPDHRNPTSVLVKRRKGGVGYGYGTETFDFPHPAVGFQFEAAHVQDCLRLGLTESPRVTKKESLMLMRITDEIRRQAGFSYPMETGG